MQVLPGHPLDGSLQRLWGRLLSDPVEVVRRVAGDHLCLAGRLMQSMKGQAALWPIQVSSGTPLPFTHAWPSIQIRPSSVTSMLCKSTQGQRYRVRPLPPYRPKAPSIRLRLGLQASHVRVVGRRRGGSQPVLVLTPYSPTSPAPRGPASLLLQRVLPRCRECVSSPSFKQRQLGLHMTQTLIACHVFDPPAITEQVLPLLLSAAEDR